MKSKAILVLVISAFLIGCDTTHKPGYTKTTGKDSLQTAKVYECPMKCEGKTYTQPGKCSVCGMELVEKK